MKAILASIADLTVKGSKMFNITPVSPQAYAILAMKNLEPASGRNSLTPVLAHKHI